MKFQNKAVAAFIATASIATHVTANTAGGPGGYSPYHHHHHGYKYHQPQQYQQFPQGQASPSWYNQADVASPQLEKEASEEKAPRENSPLPDGWSEHFDPNSGMNYYYNSATGTSTWDRPEPQLAPSIDEPEKEDPPTEYYKQEEQNVSPQIDKNQFNPQSSLGMPDTTPNRDSSSVDMESEKEPEKSQEDEIESRSMDGSQIPKENALPRNWGGSWEAQNDPVVLDEHGSRQEHPPQETKETTQESEKAEEKNLREPDYGMSGQNPEAIGSNSGEPFRREVGYEYQNQRREGQQPIPGPSMSEQSHNEPSREWPSQRLEERGMFGQGMTERSGQPPYGFSRQNQEEPARVEERDQNRGWGAPGSVESSMQHSQRSEGWGVPGHREDPRMSQWGVRKDQEVQEPPQQQPPRAYVPPTRQWGVHPFNMDHSSGSEGSRPPTGVEPRPRSESHGHPMNQPTREQNLPQEPTTEKESNPYGMTQSPPEGNQRQPQPRDRQLPQGLPQGQQYPQRLSQPPQQQQQQQPFGQYSPYGYPPQEQRHGYPPQEQRYGQYSGQYGPYGTQYYSPPPQHQQPGAGQIVSKGLEESTNALRDALGTTWSSLVGLGTKTRELTEQVRDQVVNSAAAAGHTISSQSTSFWDRAKSAVGSVFEGPDGKNPQQQQQQQQQYSMSGNYGPQPGARPQQMHPQQQQQHGMPPPQQGRYGPGPQQYPYGGPQMQPRNNVPYPHMQQGPGQRPPMQAQYGGYPPQQRPPQHDYPPQYGQQSGNPYGRGPQQQTGSTNQPRQQEQAPPQQQRQQQRQQDPWSHPGLSGEL